MLNKCKYFCNVHINLKAASACKIRKLKLLRTNKFGQMSLPYVTVLLIITTNYWPNIDEHMHCNIPVKAVRPQSWCSTGSAVQSAASRWQSADTAARQDPVLHTGSTLPLTDTSSINIFSSQDAVHVTGTEQFQFCITSKIKKKIAK